jgi:RNA polymerase sigma-70 factor (ECF subfamily)
MERMPLLNLLFIGLAFAIMQVVLRDAGDARLVDALKARKPKAMADLYRRYGRLVYSLILRMVGSASVAEDLVQETFVRVWNRVDSFDAHRGALGVWVLTIARNRAIGHLHSMSRQLQAAAVDLEKLERSEYFADLALHTLSKERLTQIEAALSKLSQEQRAVIEMAIYEGLSPSEIAEKLRQPPATVKQWIRSALRILRGEWGEVATV